MISFLVRFFGPYIQFLAGAAYSIRQTREGLNQVPTNFDAFVTDKSSQVEVIWVPFVALLSYSLLLGGLIVIAAYILGRRRGSFIALFLLALPGIASTLGLWPYINYLPDSLVLGGTGILGSVWGMFPLVFMGLLTGWSVVVILSDLWDLKDKFRHYYDHLWYSMAILTCLFFVADSNTSQSVRKLQQTTQLARQASAYLLQQVRAYDLQCQQDPSIGSVSCAWASDVQQTLSDYTTYDEIFFTTLGPKSSAAIYSPLGSQSSSQQILTIRREIKAYNDSRCPVKMIDERLSKMSRPSATCQRPPFMLCTSGPDPLDGHIEKYGRDLIVAIASECIIPSLVALREKQEKLKAVVADNNLAKHFRWLFFVLFPLVVGGKVANATSRAIELDKRPEQERRRLVGLLRPVWLGAKNAVRWTINPYIPSPPVDNHPSSTEPLAPPIIVSQHKNLGSNGSHLQG